MILMLVYKEKWKILIGNGCYIENLDDELNSEQIQIL